MCVRACIRAQLQLVHGSRSPTTGWVGRGKPTVLGIVSGAVAGLVIITPAAGYADQVLVKPLNHVQPSPVCGQPPFWGNPLGEPC